jgi:glucose/arabinose dehydrogenase
MFNSTSSQNIFLVSKWNLVRFSLVLSILSMAIWTEVASADHGVPIVPGFEAGQILVSNNCTTCHTASRFTDRSRADWESTVARMQSKPTYPTVHTAQEVQDMVDYLFEIHGLVVPPPNNPSLINIETVAEGLHSPISLANANDGTGWFYIVQQGGTIRIFDGTQMIPGHFLDISSLVSGGFEQGLLDITFHPDYINNGLFYINYTDVNGDTVIARYQRGVDPTQADPLSATVILSVTQPDPNHNGGQMEFGPDGFLYIALGDGGVPGADPNNKAQDLNSLLGKILRIDVDGGFPYAIPPGNPFIGTPNTRPEIWAYGLRNPWRFSFDRLTGDMFIADVGHTQFEEVNFQLSSSTGGENYGWPFMEGNSCFAPQVNCNDGTLTLPILEYGHGAGDCSVTGGFRYRGNNLLPQEDGIYFYADYCSGTFWGAEQQIDDSWQSQIYLDIGSAVNTITTFGEDESGNLYFIDSNGGILYKINPVLPNSHNDFNGDGTSDLLGNNTLDGSVGTGLINNTVLGTVSLLIQVDPILGWNLNATGDFNGDSAADTIFYNSITGEISVFWMDGTTILNSGIVHTLNPADTLVPFGTGDFVGSGISQVVLYDPTTGDVEALTLNGMELGAQIPVSGLPLLADGWTLIGAGNFNNDTKSDFLWHNTTTGEISYSEMNGLTAMDLVNVTTEGLEWEVVDSADYNADGKDDILLFNTITRSVRALLQDSGTFLSYVTFGNLPLTWEYIDSGDYNGDGNADLLVMDSTTGQVKIALQNGVQVTSVSDTILLDLVAGWTLHSGKP